MIRLRIIWILGCISLLVACDTSTNVTPRQTETFMKVYGSQFSNLAVDIAELNDGRLVMLGTTTEDFVSDVTTPTRDIMLIITDPDGNNAQYFVTGDPDVDEVPWRLKIGDDNTIYFGGAQNRAGNWGVLLGAFSPPTNEFLWIKGYRNIDSSIRAILDIEIFDNVLIGVGYEGSSATQYDFNLNGDLTLFSDIDIGKTAYSANRILFEVSNYSLVLFQIDNIDGTGRAIEIRKNSPVGSGNYGDFFNGNLDTEFGSLFPVDMLQVNSNANNANIYVLCNIFNNSARGQLVYNIDFEPTNGTYRSHGKSELRGDPDFEASSFIRTNDNGFILMGYRRNSGSEKRIRLKKYTNFSAEPVWVQDFGSGTEDDLPGNVIETADAKVKFNATVSFDGGATNTKMALYKLTEDGILDY